MYGYIYLTKNTLNGRMYIGKHKAAKYDESYYGSGKILLQAIERYGLDNFTNEIIDTAETLEELNSKEKYYIEHFKTNYGSLMYNIALGGDGGDTLSSKSDEEREKFIETMTRINKERCNTDEFKKRISAAGIKRYSDEANRIEQSIKIKKAWSDEKLKVEQSERLKKYYSVHKKDNTYMCKPCVFKLNNETKEFESVKDLKRFLKTVYSYTPRNPNLKKMLEAGTNGIPIESFFRGKHKLLNGVLLYYKQDKNVETMGDECSPVGDGMSASSKCKTEIEEIVHPT